MAEGSIEYLRLSDLAEASGVLDVERTGEQNKVATVIGPQEMAYLLRSRHHGFKGAPIVKSAILADRF